MKMILVLLACIAVAVQGYPSLIEYGGGYSNINNGYYGLRSVPLVQHYPVLRTTYNTYGLRTFPIVASYYGQSTGNYYHG